MVKIPYYLYCHKIDIPNLSLFLLSGDPGVQFRLHVARKPAQTVYGAGRPCARGRGTPAAARAGPVPPRQLVRQAPRTRSPPQPGRRMGHVLQVPARYVRLPGGLPRPLFVRGCGLWLSWAQAKQDGTGDGRRLAVSARLASALPYRPFNIEGE